jgi:hypothetical protein
MHRFSFLLLLLSACTTLPPAPVAPDAARADVLNWPGGHGTVEARLHSEGSSAVVASGTVSDAGVLEFVMQPVSAAQLTPFASCPGVTVSDTGSDTGSDAVSNTGSDGALRLGTFSALELPDGGRIAYASSLSVVTSGVQHTGDSYLQYTYADQAARLKGRCRTSLATFAYALELEPGWNAVRFEKTGAGLFTLSGAPLPEGSGWFFSGAGQ